MHGTGIDLLEIERLERALERRPRLAGRLFSAHELAYAASRARPAQHLAARFCAKEAVTKALGLTRFTPLEIEILGGGSKPVSVSLSGEAERRAAELEAGVEVSLTHTRTLAAAVAVLR